MDSKIVQVALSGLENILRVGKQDAFQNDGINQFAVMVEEAYGLDKIEFLQSHDNEEIYRKAFEIIEYYFSGEDEDEKLMPGIDQNADQFQFCAGVTMPQEGFQFN